MNELHIERINLVEGKKYPVLRRPIWSDDAFEKAELTYQEQLCCVESGPIRFSRSSIAAYLFIDENNNKIILTPISSYCSSEIDACYQATNLSEDARFEYCFLNE